MSNIKQKGEVMKSAEWKVEENKTSSMRDVVGNIDGERYMITDTSGGRSHDLEGCFLLYRYGKAEEIVQPKGDHWVYIHDFDSLEQAQKYAKRDAVEYK